MKSQILYRQAFRIILFLILIPMFATSLFSKFVIRQNIFEESYAFSVRSPFDSKLDLTMVPSDLHQTKNLKGLTTIVAPTARKESLEQAKFSLQEQLSKYLNYDSCQKNPSRFSTGILVKDMESEFLIQDQRVAFGQVATIISENSDLLKGSSEGICQKLIQQLNSRILSDVIPTYEKEVKKLQLVLVFYIITTLFGVFFVYLLPRFKQKRDS